MTSLPAKLRALASQEGCDGEPYDTMIEAAEQLEAAAEAMPEPVARNAAFDLLMRDICESEEGDLRDERSLCLDYDWLYQRIEQAMFAPLAAGSVPAVPEGWKIEWFDEGEILIRSRDGVSITLYREKGPSSYPAIMFYDLCEAMLAASPNGEAGDK